jgi:phenylalanyl-tRNA synthetase beta chain
MCEVSKYQICVRDINLTINKNVSYLLIKEIINKLEVQNLHSFNLINIYENNQDDTNNLLIRFELLSYNKTLSEEDINFTMNNIAKGLNINNIKVNV